MDFQDASILSIETCLKETCYVGTKASTQELFTLFLVYIPIVHPI